MVVVDSLVEIAVREGRMVLVFYDLSAGNHAEEDKFNLSSKLGYPTKLDTDVFSSTEQHALAEKSKG